MKGGGGALSSSHKLSHGWLSTPTSEHLKKCFTLASIQYVTCIVGVQGQLLGIFLVSIENSIHLITNAQISIHTYVEIHTNR